MDISRGKVLSVNGNMVNVRFEGSVMKNEVAYINVDGIRLKGEVIRVNNDIAATQIYEMTNGIKVGDEVSFTGEMLSVELGPGLLAQVYDGLQNPLPALADKCGFFLQRGVYLNPIPDRKWDFTPTVKVGDAVRPSDCIGTVPEGSFCHKIMVPFGLKDTKWTVKSIVPAGTYNVRDEIAEIGDDKGNVKKLTMVFSWPVKKPIENYKERLLPDEPMITQIRIVDSFLPVAKGGTFCTPGPFGAGKTVLQHLESKNSDVDIVIIAACGERAGEVVEILKEFPELVDPKTGRSLMERTIIICNTSSMPVAAREASVYTAVTMAEYYRQMGLDVLLLADSTSRWAQAMREMSGRLEEIPGEEAFPAYLESVIAAFYERAGKVKLYDGNTGSVTIGGSVSPAGGNFEEPVTQATLKVVGAFHGLTRERSDARKYPAIHPLDSWTKYTGIINEDKVNYARNILFKGNDVFQMMKVVGEEGVSSEDFVVYMKSELIDDAYLQQNSFDPVDAAVSPERQRYTFDVLFRIIGSEINICDKNNIRLFFNELRQLMLDWNNTEFKSEKFNGIESKIKQLISEKSDKLDPFAEKLM